MPAEKEKKKERQRQKRVVKRSLFGNERKFFLVLLGFLALFFLGPHEQMLVQKQIEGILLFVWEHFVSQWLIQNQCQNQGRFQNG